MTYTIIGKQHMYTYTISARRHNDAPQTPQKTSAHIQEGHETSAEAEAKEGSGFQRPSVASPLSFPRLPPEITWAQKRERGGAGVELEKAGHRF